MRSHQTKKLLHSEGNYQKKKKKKKRKGGGKKMLQEEYFMASPQNKITVS